jgi:ferredoxin-NADP reductase
MARAAVSRRLIWRVARLAAARPETPSARTLVLHVPGWPGHLPGQHLDVRLTAADGYRAQRSYSIASTADGDRVELTVQRFSGGEVSPYLTEVFAPGDPVELRGPVGGWFVWHPADAAPVLLVAGGSGIVPLMAMIRARAAVGSTAAFRLVYSARTPVDVIYADELRQVRDEAGVEVFVNYTRCAPFGWPHPPGRLDAATLHAHSWPPDAEAMIYVCGPTGFVESAANLLVAQGHDTERIRTERFGPSGGGT